MTPLTTDAGFEGGPTFSPDGKLIAYVSDRTGNFDIYLKRIDGGPDLQLTTDRADDVQPAFSPDGGEIAFVSGRNFPGGIIYPSPVAPLIGGDIWVMPALGGEPRKIATGNHPAWLPDGSGIVYTAGRWFERQLMRVAPSGGQPQRIPLAAGNAHLFNEVTRPAVSPDGRWIAFESDRQVFIVPVAGGTPSRLVSGTNPAWAPDNASLFFTSGDPKLNGGLGRISVDRNGRAAGEPETLIVGAHSAADPVVASDGVHVAFEAEIVRANVEELPFDAEGNGEIPGARPRALTTGNEVIFFFSLSPDERTLVYAARQRIWKGEPGRAPVPLTSGGVGGDTQPRWSPDGQLIAFARGSSAARAMSAASLWVMNPDGSNPREVAGAASMNGFFGWSSDGKALIALDPQATELNERQFRRIDLASGKSQVLTREPGLLGIGTESRDGSWLAMQATNPKTGDVDLRALPTDGSMRSRVVASTPGDDVHPMFSPSGRWLYWIVDHQNVYRVPGPAQNWRAAQPDQVTSFARSGLFLEDAQLSPDGRKLLYARRERTADIWLMELKIDGGK
jgi:Tol biopolymer transport system component